MKRAIVVLLLLTANAIVGANRINCADEPASQTKVAQASSLHGVADRKLEACATL